MFVGLLSLYRLQACLDLAKFQLRFALQALNLHLQRFACQKLLYLEDPGQEPQIHGKNWWKVFETSDSSHVMCEPCTSQHMGKEKRYGSREMKCSATVHMKSGLVGGAWLSKEFFRFHYQPAKHKESDIPLSNAWHPTTTSPGAAGVAAGGSGVGSFGTSSKKPCCGLTSLSTL